MKVNNFLSEYYYFIILGFGQSLFCLFVYKISGLMNVEENIRLWCIISCINAPSQV